MSASQDKKRRTDERALGMERRQVASQKEAKERKQSKIKWTVGSIIVVLLVVAILLGNSSLFYTARPALQVGDVKYSSAEVNYAYRTAYLSFCNQYGSYLSAVNLDTKRRSMSRSAASATSLTPGTIISRTLPRRTWCRSRRCAMPPRRPASRSTRTTSTRSTSSFSYIELAAKQYKYNSVSKYLQAAYGNGVTRRSCAT